MEIILNPTMTAKMMNGFHLPEPTYITCSRCQTEFPIGANMLYALNDMADHMQTCLREAMVG